MSSLDINDEQDGSRPLTRSETEELIQLVKHRKLPALSESERVHLVAMIDTFGEVKFGQDVEGMISHMIIKDIVIGRIVG